MASPDYVALFTPRVLRFEARFLFRERFVRYVGEKECFYRFGPHVHTTHT